jgi:hypothetical protein
MNSTASFQVGRGLATHHAPGIFGQRRSHRYVTAILIAICLVTALAYGMAGAEIPSAQQGSEPAASTADEITEYAVNPANTRTQRYEGLIAKTRRGVLRSVYMSGREMNPHISMECKSCILRLNLQWVKMASRSGAPRMSTLQLRRCK